MTTGTKEFLGLLALCGVFFAELQAAPTQALPMNVYASSTSPTDRPLIQSSFIQRRNFYSKNLKLISPAVLRSGKLVISAASRMNDAPLSYNNNDANNFDRMRDLTKMDDARATDAETLIIGQDRTMIWEIQKGSLKRMNFNDFTALRTDKCYVLLQNSLDEETGNIIANTFYWVGKNSSHLDAASAASQAISLDAKIHPVVQIRREVEGQESFDFQMIFKQTKKPELGSISSSEALMTKVDENRKRMFVISGEDAPNYREVELSSVHVLGNDNKCLVFVSDKVYVTCRRGATERHKKSARELARIMMKRKKLKVEEVKILKIDKLFSEVSDKEQEDLRQFFAEFGKISADLARQQIADNPERFTAEELRRITDQTSYSSNGEEFFRTKTTRIYEVNYGQITEEENYGSPHTPIILMDTKECFIVDTQSNLGLIVWMGENSEIQLRRECAKRAEIYAKENGYDYATPIVYVDQRGIPRGLVGDIQTLIHVIHVNDVGTEQSTDDMLENDGQLNFVDSATIPLDGPIAVIFRVKEGRLERITDGVALESDQSYVIFQNTMDKTLGTNASIFYWIGQNSSEKDAADAAAHAVVLDSRVHQTPQIHREAEGQETAAFRTFFEQILLKNPNFSVKWKDEGESSSMTKSSKKGTGSVAKSSKRVNTRKKKMFSIGGKPKRLTYREIPLSYTNLLENDGSCLVLVSEKVYVACGTYAADRHKKGAKALAKIMMARRNMIVTDIRVHQIDQLFSPQLPPGEQEDLRKFFAEFDRIPVEEAEKQTRAECDVRSNVENPFNANTYTSAKLLIAEDPEVFEPEEMRRILDQTIPQFNGGEWFNVKVFAIHEEYGGAIKEDLIMSFELIPLEKLNDTDCYIIDTQSTVGLFVWMGRESPQRLREETARKAERYLKKEGYSNTTLITYLGQDDVKPDLESVQSLVYFMNPENKSIDERLAEAKTAVVDEIKACRNCKSSGMCANCPERKAALESRDTATQKSNVAGADVSIMDIISPPPLEETDRDSVSEDSSTTKVDVAANAVVDVSETEKPNLRKDSARANKLPARRAPDGATTKSENKTMETLLPLKKIIEQHGETLENALNFSQIVQLLETSNNKDITVIEALKPLQLSLINPYSIIEQLERIYSNVKNRGTKIRITKLKNKIYQEFGIDEGSEK